MEFKDRLQNYRDELGIKTKREMAKKLEISEPLYCLLENGSRKPSQDVLDKLFLLSDKPEEYWVYGVSEDQYTENRKEFKMVERMTRQLIDIGLIKSENISQDVQDVLLSALKADIRHLLDKKKK